MFLYFWEASKNWDDFSKYTAVGKSAMCKGKINETLQIERNSGGNSVEEKCMNG